MTRQDFIEKMRTLVPGADAVSGQWCRWLEEHGVPCERMYAAFYGVYQQYGGELAGLLFMTGPAITAFIPTSLCWLPNICTRAAPSSRLTSAPPMRQGRAARCAEPWNHIREDGK